MKGAGFALAAGALLALPILAVQAAPAGAQPPTLEASTELSETGYYDLSWGGAEGAAGDQEVVLEEASASDFADARILYQGTDTATVVTGRLDGVYHYRLRTADGASSQPIQVTVAHHGAAKTFFFLALGGGVFLATAALIVGGHRRSRRELLEGGSE